MARVDTRKTIFLLAVAILGSLALSALVYVGVINEFLAQILSLGAINVVVALSLNLISGFCGQLALGQAGFMAIGAYTTAFCAMRLHLPLPVGMLAGGLLSALAGFLVGFPALRLRGDYLAIVTLGFGEIIRVIMINLEGITGGAAGLKGIPSFTNVLLMQPAMSFFVTMMVMALTVAVLKRVMDSSYGRAVMSIREDEIAASSVGIPAFRYKMAAFTGSAFIAGIGGGLYAPFFQYLNPINFDFLRSVDFVVFVVMGGMGSITGTVLSGLSLTLLRDWVLVNVGSLDGLGFIKQYRLVFFPLILILVMIFRPGGLMGKREWSPAYFFLEWLPSRFKRKSPPPGGRD
jgi:branched-chain amino acid transport system permease protein